MSNTVLLEKPNEVFAKFDEKIESFFTKKDIIINLYPNDIISTQEIGATSLKITSADQYFNYLNSEIEFWKTNDPNKRLESIAYYNRFQSAKQYFDNALKYTHAQNSMENYLQQSVNYISGSSGALSSKTSLARKILEYKDKSSYFLSGFKTGMLINGDNNVGTSSNALQGFYAAMAYRKIFDSYVLKDEEKVTEFKSAVDESIKNYAVLNDNYTKAYLEQEKRLESITKQSDNYLTELNTKSECQYKDADTRLNHMEKVYREKLRLEAPAEYWAKLKNSYSTKGYVWFGVSVSLAIAIIGLLLFALIKDIIIFHPEASWIENLKNSAIITLIASIAIYVLRLTTKMALSSHHLARDARERENLSYFYLSLIEKGAVTDKERALILNALFSRSDTGLLKGESSPSMPTNISDIIKIIPNDNH